MCHRGPNGARARAPARIGPIYLRGPVAPITALYPTSQGAAPSSRAHHGGQEFELFFVAEASRIATGRTPVPHTVEMTLTGLVTVSFAPSSIRIVSIVCIPNSDFQA